MLGAFATGALASALAAAGLTGVVLWAIGVVMAGGRPFALTPAAMAIVGFLVGVVVLIAERVANRRTRTTSNQDPARRSGDPRG